MWRLILLLCAFTLAACGAEQAAPVGALPTLAELPSPLPGATPTPTVTEPPSQTPTDTLTPIPSLTETATVTPSATITDTPTSTPTPTATPTERVGAVSLLALLAAQATVLPPTYIAAITLTPAPDPLNITSTPPPAAVTCPYPPPGGFAFAFQADPTLSGQIGCPVGAPPTASQIGSAYQTFERGAMTWLSGPIYALFSDGRFRRFDDTFVAGVDPDSGGENPPFPLVEPVRGFGKVWRSSGDVRAGLGWGLNAEAGGQAALQRFDRGWMVYLPQRGDILILIEDPGGQAGSWHSVPGQF